MKEGPGIRELAAIPLSVPSQADPSRSPRSCHKRSHPGGEWGGNPEAGEGSHGDSSSPRSPPRFGSPQEVKAKRKVQGEVDGQGEKHAGNLPRPRLGRWERPVPVSAPSLRLLTPDPCPRANPAHPSDSYTRCPGIPHRAPDLHSAAQPVAAAANIRTAEPLQPPPPPHRCHSSSCASPCIRRLPTLSPAGPAPRPHATAYWPPERPQ